MVLLVVLLTAGCASPPGLIGRFLTSQVPAQAGGRPDVDARVLEVLRELGVRKAEGKVGKLLGQVGGAVSSGDAITESVVREALAAIARLPVPGEPGGEVIDQKGARRVVERVLAATARSALVHPINVLRAGADDIVHVQPGTKMLLDTVGSFADLGSKETKKIDLRPMGLDLVDKKGPAQFWLDILFQGADGLVAKNVVDSPTELKNPRVASRVTRTLIPFAAGPDQMSQLHFKHDGDWGVLATPVDGIVRLPSEVVKDFAQVVPIEVQAKLKNAFKKPRRSTFAVVAVVPHGMSPELISQRTSRKPDHAEDLIVRGDIEEAVRWAATVGTKGNPAVVAITLNRSPCGPCAGAVGGAYRAAIEALAAGQRANVIGVLSVPHAYEGKEPPGAKGGPTTSGHLDELRAAGLLVVQLTVDGKITEKGRGISDGSMRDGKSTEGMPPNLLEILADTKMVSVGPDGRPLSQQQLQSMGAVVSSGSAAEATTIFNVPAPAALADPAQPVPGGIDFSSLELRYLADIDAGKGVRYAFQGDASTDGKTSGDGLKAAQTASDAFFVWLALPPESFTVNLNPNKPKDILDAGFARTDAGRILLEANLALKKTTAALLSPETELGKRVFDSLRYAEGAKRCVSARTWIEPGVATVRATESEVYILDAPLSVQRESAYLHKYEGQVPSKTCPEQDPALELQNEEVMQTMLLPKLLEVVNQAPEFQDLRNVYLSRVAAQWVRDRNARTPTVYSDIIDSGNIDRWPARQPWDPMEVFNRYVKSFNEKEFRVEEKTIIDGGRSVRTTVRSYGGVNFTNVPQTEVDLETFTSTWNQLPATVSSSLHETTREADGQRLWLGGTGPPAAATPEPWRESNDGDEPQYKGKLGFPAALGAFALIVAGWSLVVRRSVRPKSQRGPECDDARPQRQE